MKPVIEFDVCVIGLGRVGLPLTLFLAKNGLRVAGIDNNTALIDMLDKNEMPFKEDGCQEILERVTLKLSSGYRAVEYSKNIIITVGTPIEEDREINLCHIRKVIDSILPYIKYGDKKNIILRSTVEPGMTKNIIDYIERKNNMKCGVDFNLCFCPERLVEGKALNEMATIPNIVGVENDESYESIKSFLLDAGFNTVIKASTVEAELSKVFLNMSRYAYFGVVNYLATIAELYNCDIYNILNIANFKYPRKILYSPGLTSGTCLKKDWRMLNANLPHSELFQIIDNINQNFYEIYLLQILNEIPKDSKIGILGYTFKKDTDDIRDSIVPKIIRKIKGHFFDNIMIHDYNITVNHLLYEHQDYWTSQDSILKESDFIIIAMNHSEYYDIKFNNEFILDIWNVTGENKIMQYNIR